MPNLPISLEVAGYLSSECIFIREKLTRKLRLRQKSWFSYSTKVYACLWANTVVLNLGSIEPQRLGESVWRSHGKVNERKQTIYYIQIYINPLDFTNDPISLHNYIRNSYLLKRTLAIYPNSISVYSLFLSSFACALKPLTRPLHISSRGSEVSLTTLV